MERTSERHIGLFGATTIGVGAIVGGGILALAGVALAATGPSAIVAFMLNGGIALLTAASFAQLATTFPESGGTYTYAKKVMSVEVAFTVGWVVWFASIVAAVLYALGFAAFGLEIVARLAAALGFEMAWVGARSVRVGVALAAVTLYTLALVRRLGGGDRVATIGKLVVFAALILGGGVAFLRTPLGVSVARLDPFTTAGAGGIARAMGYTFIAMQGFDLIAAVGGEVRDPQRTLPRSMFGIAFVIYLPLLFLISTVGVAGDGRIADAAAANPEGIVADAAGRFLGPVGYWLVLLAGVMSMLSALQANLLGASRVVFTMARDRTLPRLFGRVRPVGGAPAMAVLATAVAVGIVVVIVGEVAIAGAASSLIFLISFGMAHWAAILARRRAGDRRFPLVPVCGAILCVGLAVFQGIAVREAGQLVTLWLGAGVVLYLTLLAPGARTADAAAEARDPHLARLRGRSPLVLVPIANPESAAGLVGVAGAVVTPGSGRILLLSVVDPHADGDRARTLRDARDILGEALETSLAEAFSPETLFTLANDPWPEIARVARGYRCETLLLGLPSLEAPDLERHVEELLPRVDSDVVVLRLPHRFRIADARRILLAMGGRGDHSHLRARLLSSLARTGERSVTFLRTLPADAPDDALRRARRQVGALAREEAAGAYEVLVERSDDPVAELVRQASSADLVVMGMRGHGRRRVFGDIPLHVARETDKPLLLIGRRGPRHLR